MNAHPDLWLLFSTGFLSATLLPGGSEANLIWLIKHHEYSLILLILIASLGNTLGAMVNYALGRCLPVPTHSKSHAKVSDTDKTTKKNAKLSATTAKIFPLNSIKQTDSKTCSKWTAYKNKIDYKAKARALKWLQKLGQVALFFSWLPIIGDPLCFVAGWMRLNQLACWFWIGFGKTCRYIGLAYLITHGGF